MAYKDLLLKPTRNYDPHEVLSEFRTDFTGQAGLLVKVSANDPDDDTYYASAENVGAGFAGIYSKKYVAPRYVTKAGAGDAAGSILGITLQGTAETDIHGNKINGFADGRRWAEENNYVASGEPVQIATRGNFWLNISQVAGTPAPGSGLVAAADGAFTVIDPANLVAAGTGTYPVGKVLSTSGTRQGDVNVLLQL